ncbi:T6SS effector BTH_I2691 family protein [Luteimonas salinilitoris]|uniref:T6SS effector BTH_I2691 family protein n=1 Tax=Luteimonas salinilitoris TaxID=3237697 RepID=A0ABV4HLJ8_9GAMM
MADAQTQQQEFCPNCTKFGLPILPLRYAVARNDASVTEQAPELTGSFGDGVRDIAMPDVSARYTLRLLRSGYLYVFNETRGEWKAYQVGEDAQLIEFDIRDKAPPPQTEEDEHPAVCSRHGNPPTAKCVIIPDAANAGPVWLAFSDVAWTQAMLAYNRTRANREKHMRRIDVAAWVGGGGEATQPHLQSLAGVREHVAEYHLEPPASEPNTPEMIAEHEARNASLPEEKRSILLENVTVKAYMAFSHSLDDFGNCSPEAEQLIDDAQRAGERWGYPPAMVALDDPSGIAADLNELAKQRLREWAQAPERKKKHESALLIGAVRQAVENGGELQTSERRRQTMGILGALMPAHVGAAYGGRPGIRGVANAMDRAGRLSESELEAIHADAWEKYEDMYDEAARKRYLENEYPAELAAFEESTIKALDEAYIGWMGSAPFREYFRGNFDPNHVQSGVVYTGVLYTVLNDASGRKLVCDYMEQCFDADPSDPNSILCRGLVFNQDQLARKWMDTTGEVPEPDGGWNGMVERLWSVANTLLGEAAGSLVTAARASLNNYAYEYSGVLIRKLKKIYDLRTGALIASQVEPRALSILGMIARSDAPEYRLMTVRTEMNRMQARWVMGRAAEAAADPRRRSPYSPRELRNMYDPRAGRVTFQGVVLVEQTQYAHFEGVQRLSPEEFDLRMQSSVRLASRIEAGGHFVAALLALWSLGSAWDDMKKAPSAKTKWSFASGVAALSGTLMETAGTALKTSQWGAMPFGKTIVRRAGTVVTRSQALSFAGRMIGMIGGVISGVLTIVEGFSEYSISPVYGLAMVGLGTGMVIAAVMLGIGMVSGPVGIIITLILALIAFLVSFLKKDEIQKWLDRTVAFGHHRQDSFGSIEAQWQSMQTLGSEEAATAGAGGG